MMNNAEDYMSTYITNTDDIVIPITSGVTDDAVSHPSHYTSGKYEVIDIIEDQLGIEGLHYFCVGNAIKYLMRHGKKDKNKEIEDLKKAAWYINHYIERVESGVKKNG